MHSASINLGKDLKGQSIYLRWFLEEHPTERECLLKMYPNGRRWLVRLLLNTRWISLLETEISMAAALSDINARDQSQALQTLSAAYHRRPADRGVTRWIHGLLKADPMRLKK